MAIKEVTKPVKPATNGSTHEVERLELDLQRIELKVKGLSPLIMNKWSEKAKQQMLDKQTKAAKHAKEAKDPQADYQNSIYHLDDGYGFPAVAFKASMVRAGSYSDLKMTFLRGAFHIQGELVPILGEPRMREDMVRVGMGTADIRFRAEFPEWSAMLPIIFNRRAISIDQIVNLANVAGFAVGVGEWRPERDGQFGLFEVVG